MLYAGTNGRISPSKRWYTKIVIWAGEMLSCCLTVWVGGHVGDVEEMASEFRGHPLSEPHTVLDREGTEVSRS